MSPPPDLGTRNKNLLKQEQEKYWAPVYRETHTHTHLILMKNMLCSKLYTQVIQLPGLWTGFSNFLQDTLRLDLVTTSVVLKLSIASERKAMCLEFTLQLITIQKWRCKDYALPTRERTKRTGHQDLGSRYALNLC